MKFVLTARDLAVLEALGKYRYLRTGQISRLIFPENNTVQSARRRLKYLYHSGYIGRIQPMLAEPINSSELAYFLEAKGRELLDDDQLPQFSLKNHVKPAFLRHALEVSEFRLNLELALKAIPEIEMHRCVMDFELKSHTEQAVGRRKHRLFDEVHDPIGKRKITVHPDLLVVLRSVGKKQFQRLFFVEIDRGTEGLRVIADKLTGYHLYKRESIFKKFGEFQDFRVLFQTTSIKRATNIQKLASDFSDVLDVWVTEDQATSDRTVLLGSIWRTPQEGELSAILKGQLARSSLTARFSYRMGDRCGATCLSKLTAKQSGHSLMRQRE